MVTAESGGPSAATPVKAIAQQAVQGAPEQHWPPHPDGAGE